MDVTLGAQISVVGGGLIGISWAALFAAYGYDVILFEPDVAAHAPLQQALAKPMAQIATLDAALPPAGRIMVTADLQQSVGTCAFVQENAPENVALKRGLYTQIEALAPPDVTIASSTSSLVWSDLSAEMIRPNRLITAHPFNPPHLMPLVEMFGPDTARVQAASAFYKSLARHPVCLKREAVGHIANRLSSALWREAVHMVAEDIADVAAIDAALVYGPGLRWSVIGAHLAYHLGGGAGGIDHYLDHLGPSQERRWQDLGMPRLDAATKEKLKQGIRLEAADRSVASLETARDDALIALQRALSGLRP